MGPKIEPSRLSVQLPSWELRDSYIENLREVQAADPSRNIQWQWLENFQLYLDSCKRQSELTQMVDGMSPAITKWIVLDNKIAVGKLSLHPIITPRLQVLGGHMGYEVRPSYRRQGIAEIACGIGLRQLKELGFREVFITCDEDNIGSRRVLEKNGGKLVDRYELPEWPKPVVKFEFALDRLPG